MDPLPVRARSSRNGEVFKGAENRIRDATYRSQRVTSYKRYNAVYKFGEGGRQH